MNKSRLPIIFLFSLIALASHAQEWVLQNPFGRLGKIQAIDFTENGIGYGVGQNGLIVTTENFGGTWTLSEPPELFNNRDVHIVDGTDGTIAYIGGQVSFKTVDQGQSWTRLNVPISNVVDIFSFNEDHLYFASVQGKVYKTEDGGDSFIEVPLPYGRYEGVFFVDEMNGWITGSVNSEGKILHTTDGGVTWDISSETYDFIGKIQFISAQIGFFHGSTGLYKTTDGGNTWNVILSDHNIANMFIYNEDNIWVVWGTGYQKTTDGGLTWSDHSSVVGTVECIYLSDPNTVWLGGNSTSIHHSMDGGQSYSDQIPGNKSNLPTIQFYDDQIGYAGSESGEVLRTINGGASWQESIIPGNPVINELDLIDQNNILAATSDGLFLSEDGAQTWASITDGSISSVAYINANNIIYCKTSSIYKTNISGSSQAEVLTGQSFSTVHFNTDLNGLATTWQGKIFHTADGGNTWTLQYTQVDGDLLESIFFSDEQNGFILSSRYSDYILHTTDGGLIWMPQDIGISSFWRGGHFINETTGWIVGGGSGIIYLTEDGGDTWERDFSFSRPFLDITAPISDEKLAWVSGGGGMIMRFSNCNTDPRLFDLTLPQAICQNDTITAEVGFEGIDIFSWSVPNGWSIFGNDNSSEIQIVVGENGGNISVIGSNSCEDSTEPIVQSTTSISNPDATIVFSAGLLRSQTSGASYQWYLNGDPIPGAIEHEYAPTASGEYYIRVGYDTGCQSAPSNTINHIISSTTLLNGKEIKLFPNPASNQFYLEGISDRDQVELWSISGRFIKNFENRSSYSINDVPAGLYLIKIKAKQELGILKMMVRH